MVQLGGIMKERLKLIIEDLKAATKPITAKELARRRNVSLRTIRNDLNEIDKIITKNGGALVKIPGVGILLNPAFKEDIHQYLSVVEFIELNYRQRSVIIFLLFALSTQNQPMGAEVIADVLDISKSTVHLEIARANELLSYYRIIINGQKGKGFQLIGTVKDCILFMNEQEEQLSSDNVKRVISDVQSKGLLQVTEAKQIIRSIQKEKALVPNPQLMGLYLTMLIRANDQHIENVKADIRKDMKQVKKIVEAVVDFELNPQLMPYYAYVISKYSGLELPLLPEAETKLKDCIDHFIVETEKHVGRLNADIIGLKQDLFLHLRGAFDKLNLQFSEKNPLLNMIKTRYLDLFQGVKNSAHVIEDLFQVTLTDDEISYLVLYFAKSIDYKHKNRTQKTIILCNTGRGAAKLLHSRIMNNLPELEIVGLFNPAQLETIQEDFDIIISTIKVTHEKPVIVVSPLLHENEIQRIRNAIYNDDQTDYNTANIQSKSVYSNIEKIDSELYAMVVLEVVKMFQEYRITDEPYEKLAGVLTHIIMSIPRWMQEVYISSDDYELFMQKYPFYMTITNECLNRVAAILNVFIPTKEAIPIVRYVI